MASPFSTVFKGAQIGLLSGIGDDQPADIKIAVPGFGRIMPKSSGGYTHTGQGNRQATATLPPGMNWGEVDFSGPMDFRCITYLLAAGFGLDTPAADGSNGWFWEFFLPLNSEVEPQYLAYENGNASRAERALNAFVNSYQFNISKGTQSYSGKMLTGEKQRGATITPSPGDVDASIVRSQAFDFYAADSKSALDTAVDADDKFPIPLSVVITFPDIAEVLGRMNSAELSWFSRLPKAIAPTLALKAADDSDFDDLVDILATGAAKFFAARAFGNVIAGGTPSQEELRFNFCGTLIEPETPDEEASAATNTLTFQNQHDSTWGRAHDIQLTNDLPSL